MFVVSQKKYDAAVAKIAELEQELLVNKEANSLLIADVEKLSTALAEAEAKLNETKAKPKAAAKKTDAKTATTVKKTTKKATK